MFRALVRPDLQMRLLEERHAGALFGLIDQDREDLREWLPFVDATHAQDDTLSFIRSSLEHFAANNGLTSGIWSNDEICGVVGTLKIDWLNRRVEVGYWLGKAFRGKGIITDCSRSLISHLFDELDLNRVEIQAAAGNLKSSAVAERLGFTLEGTRRQAQMVRGKFLDLRMFSMLKSQWVSR